MGSRTGRVADVRRRFKHPGLRSREGGGPGLPVRVGEIYSPGPQQDRPAPSRLLKIPLLPMLLKKVQMQGGAPIAAMGTRRGVPSHRLGRRRTWLVGRRWAFFSGLLGGTPSVPLFVTPASFNPDGHSPRFFRNTFESNPD